MLREDGSVIVLSMIVITTLLILVVSMVGLIISEIQTVDYAARRSQAFYNAETGIEYARVVMDDNNKWDPTGVLDINSINNSITTGVLEEVSRWRVSKGYQVSSIGHYQGVSVNIIATLSAGLGKGIFSHSLVSSGQMSLYDNSVITGNEEGGDIYSNSEVYPDNELILYNCLVNENQTKNIFPWIDLQFIRDNYNNSDLNNIGNNLTYINALVNSDNTLTLANDNPLYINGEGVMLVDGNLKVHDRLYFNNDTDQYFILIVTGDIYIHDIFYGNGLIYSYGNTLINDVQNFLGSIISEGTLGFEDTIEITFSNDYIDLFQQYGVAVNETGSSLCSNYRIIAWEEK